MDHDDRRHAPTMSVHSSHSEQSLGLLTLGAEDFAHDVVALMPDAVMRIEAVDPLT
jgi:hypothetical protein